MFLAGAFGNLAHPRDADKARSAVVEHQLYGDVASFDFVSTSLSQLSRAQVYSCPPSSKDRFSVMGCVRRLVFISGSGE